MSRKERFWVVTVTVILIVIPVFCTVVFADQCYSRGGELYNGACMAPGLRR